MKRIFDLTLSLLLILISLPLMIIIISILKYLYRGPIFFSQIRAGLNGTPFKIIKFRTFSSDKIILGKFALYLRKVKLDEIPQLINILIGDLSFVGPRPLYLDYIKLYNSDQMKRLSVKPGLTGLAQIRGGNALSWKEKFEIDCEYVNKKNFFLDMKIILITFYKFIFNFFLKDESFEISQQDDFKGN